MRYGCTFKVGKRFPGCYIPESFTIELKDNDIDFVRELEMPIYYKQKEIGSRRVDFFINGLILVELKAITQLDKVHICQTLNYLEAFKMKLGLLINFGEPRLKFHRLIHEKKLGN